MALKHSGQPALCRKNAVWLFDTVYSIQYGSPECGFSRKHRTTEKTIFDTGIIAALQFLSILLYSYKRLSTITLGRSKKGSLMPVSCAKATRAPIGVFETKTCRLCNSSSSKGLIRWQEADYNGLSLFQLS